MLVHIYSDERCPDYGVDREPHPNQPVIEVSDELLAEVDAAEKAYTAVQVKLQELAKQQRRRVA
jgi:hypothetical protein